jgi:hypothetical protein
MQPDREAGWVLDHYGCDRTRAWRICRWHFPWSEGKKPPMRTLSLILSPDEVTYSSPRFTVTAPGNTVTLIHPLTGETYTLTVEELTAERLPAQAGVPPHFTRMSYSMSPEPPRRLISIADCASSDPVDTGFTPDEASAIGIIGGADGPTAVFVAGVTALFHAPGMPTRHSACSSPRQKPADTLEWRAIFHVKPCEDICVKLI